MTLDVYMSRTRQPHRHLQQPPGRWGEVFGDDVVAEAMIDRLVRHAEVVALKGDSNRLKNRPRPSARGRR
jgi:DNA replication protein DnaC